MSKPKFPIESYAPGTDICKMTKTSEKIYELILRTLSDSNKGQKLCQR